MNKVLDRLYLYVQISGDVPDSFSNGVTTGFKQLRILVCEDVPDSFSIWCNYRIQPIANSCM